jgi:hypothetical protein
LNISIKEVDMNRELSDRGYIQLGKVVIVTKAGEEYVYCDGGLTPLTTTDDPNGRAGLDGGLTSTV